MQILYEVLNERDWIVAERTYSVWPDLEKIMREDGIPQFTVDAHRPVGAFDVFGLSFSTELGYTNMLNALDLAGIPLHAADRGEDHPIVLAGGHAAFNPEPIADFLDAAVLGDGEEVVLAISEVVREWKAEDRPGGRDELLRRLAVSGGVYVQVLRRRVRRGRHHRGGRPEPPRHRTPPTSRCHSQRTTIEATHQKTAKIIPPNHAAASASAPIAAAAATRGLRSEPNRARGAGERGSSPITATRASSRR